MTRAYQKKLSSHGIAVAVIAALSIITYLNCFSNQFVYDDTSTIADTYFIKDWKNFPSLFTHDYFKYSGELTYRPIVTLSYFIDYSLWHLNPAGYHIVNVLLHTINTILTYLFVLLLCRSFSTDTYPGKTPTKANLRFHTEIAALTSIFFAIHPIVSEVVNLVSYREDLLATAFLIASFFFFLRYRKKATAPFCIITLLAYFLALFSKESAIVLPALVFFFELIFSPYTETCTITATPLKAALDIIRRPFFLGYIGISIVYLVIRFLVLHNPGEKIAYPEGSFLINMLTVAKVLGRYLANIFMPFGLNADYHVLFIKTPLSRSFLIPFFAFLSTVIIAIRLKANITFPLSNNKGNRTLFREKYAILIFSILWFFISILPVMNIIPLANIMADRYLYFPILGFCLFISTALTSLKTGIKYPLIILLIIFYCSLTVNRNNIWRDEFTLWHKSSQSPLCSFTTYNNLGTQYNKKGYPDAALTFYQKAIQKAREAGFTHYSTVYYNIGNVFEKKELNQQAVSAYKKAIQIQPDYKQAHNNLGKVYFILEQYENALAEYNNAIMIDPDFAYAYNNVGVLYNKLGRQNDAIQAYQKALSLDPQYGDAYYNLGNVYEAKKQYDLALEAYKTATGFNPTQVYVHNNLGAIYEKKGMLENAEEEYFYVIEHDPKYPYSYNNLGVCLIKKGDMHAALVQFQKAAELLPNQPDFHFNIGYTYLQTDDLVNAMKAFETALKIAPSHTEALYCMGTIYHRQGDTETAAKIWQKVVALNPNHGGAKKYLETLSHK